MKHSSKYFIVFFILLAFLGGFGIGRLSGESPFKKSLSNTELGKPATLDFSLFWDAWNLIETKFVDRSNLNKQAMIFGAIDGLAKSLGDPYSVFFNPKDAKDFSEELKGAFDGIGVEIGNQDGTLTVIAPLEGTPAQKSGLGAGDKILKVDEKTTADLTLDEAISKIKGPSGSEVVLTVLKKGEKKPQEIKITRDKIEVPVLKTEIKDGYAYIQLFSFNDKAGEEFKKAVAGALDKKIKGVVLDLRNNPGGYLEGAVELAGWFLNEGDLVVTEDYGNGKQIIHKAYGPSKLLGYPLVILINEGSASASEILAGALKDHGKAKLVGEKSFGKGSVQQLEELGSGASIKITIAKWLTPSGHSIDKQGIVPDEEVKFSAENYAAGKDDQKERAIEILHQLINAGQSVKN